jgi:hypothetical protein
MIFDPVTIVCFLACAIFISFPLLVKEKTLERFWSLRTLDPDWDKSFPDVEDRDIFTFLDILVASLGHHGKCRLKPKPTAKVSEVYKALYPPDGELDDKETQAFVQAMKTEFGLDLSTWEEPSEMELADLFAFATRLKEMGGAKS